MTELTIRGLAWLSTLRDRLEREQGALSIELTGVIVVLGVLVTALIAGAQGWAPRLTSLVDQWISSLGA
ncbi:MAG: hypothetical protein H0V93_04565 [Euzebyales bacterium]|jgi:hypothetical protein|nr:hypothetical protein [Euzebyales bacterium]